MSNSADDYFELDNGDVRLWILPDRGTPHIKCVTKHGDPVELIDEEVDELIEVLKKLVVKLR